MKRSRDVIWKLEEHFDKITDYTTSPGPNQNPASAWIPGTSLGSIHERWRPQGSDRAGKQSSSSDLCSERKVKLDLVEWATRLDCSLLLLGPEQIIRRCCLPGCSRAWQPAIHPPPPCHCHPFKPLITPWWVIDAQLLSLTSVKSSEESWRFKKMLQLTKNMGLKKLQMLFSAMRLSCGRPLSCPDSRNRDSALVFAAFMWKSVHLPWINAWVRTLPVHSASHISGWESLTDTEKCQTLAIAQFGQRCQFIFLSCEVSLGQNNDISTMKCFCFVKILNQVDIAKFHRDIFCSQLCFEMCAKLSSFPCPFPLSLILSFSFSFSDEI